MSEKKDKQKSMAVNPDTQIQPDKKKTYNRKTTILDSIRRGIDPVESKNKYYIRIAVKYKAAKYAVILLTLIFAIVMLTVYSSEITVENFQYMFKDLDVSDITADGSYDSLVYNGGSNAVFGFYKGDLAVVTSGSTSLYNSAGAVTFQKDNVFVSPSVLTSDKYMLVYDRGDTSCSYALYNSFDLIKTEQLDTQISTAVISDTGSFALILSDGKIRLYDSSDNFSYKEIRKDKFDYVICGVFSNDGKDLYVASASDSGGQYVTEISRITDNDPVTLSVVNGDIPVSMKFTDESYITVILTESIITYDMNGNIVSELPMSSNLPTYAALGSEMICVVNNVNGVGNDKTVMLYSPDGSIIYSGSDTGELLKLRIYGSRVYLLFENRLSVIDAATKNNVLDSKIPSNGIDVVVTDSGLPLVCYSGNALAVSQNNT